MNTVKLGVAVAVIVGVALSSGAESTGPLSLGTAAVTSTGTYGWTNITPASQTSIDGNSSTISIPGGGQTSDEIFVSGFGASVPLNATVVGLRVTYEIATTGLGAAGSDVATITMGSIATPGTPVVVDIPDSGGVFFSAPIGGPFDTWGLTLTPAIVNDPGFGIFSEVTSVNSGTETLDRTQLEIFYTLPGYGPRILIVGDSWASGIGNLLVFESVLNDEGGLATVTMVKEGIGGSTAAQWATNHDGKLDAITSALNTNPTIDVVHINLGGNDLNAAAGSIITEQDLIDELESIADDVDTVVDHIHGIDPSIRVGWGSYDYLASAASNPALIAMVPIGVAHAAAKSNFDFINAMGYIHYEFGFPGEFAAGATPIPGGFPEYIPAGGGDPAFAGTPAYNDGGIHLVFAGYKAYIERAFNEFYRAWLLEDQGGSEIWIDFAHRGDELGTSGIPMNDLTNAATMVDPGGTLKIKGNTADSTTPETIMLDKAMRIEADSGAVTIGASGARRSTTSGGGRSGFVSNR